MNNLTPAQLAKLRTLWKRWVRHAEKAGKYAARIELKPAKSLADLQLFYGEAMASTVAACHAYELLGVVIGLGGSAADLTGPSRKTLARKRPGVKSSPQTKPRGKSESKRKAKRRVRR